VTHIPMSVAMTVAGLLLASCGSEGDRPGTAATSSLPVTPTSAVVVPPPRRLPGRIPAATGRDTDHVHERH
jgi:hypothetical protein